MAKRPLDPRQLSWETRLSLAGRAPARFDGAVNPPVHRASTLIISDTDDLYNTTKKTYALEGMAVQEALRAALAETEGGADAILAPSGLAACTLALLTTARAGGEILVTDSVYGPTRRFCDTMLKRLGVEVRYFDPRIGGGIEALFNNNTCGVFLESPGSLTFEVQDVPAIAVAARARNVPVLLDNTWSAGVYFKPFQHGVDLSVQAITKYQAGHADLLLGAVIARDDDWAGRVQAASRQLGLGTAPDDCYLALRGMRTLAVRLSHQSAAALTVATWLLDQPRVACVLHPALPSHPDHAIWRRDFAGASGVFAVVLNAVPPQALKRMLESLSLFSMGFSWGGYESLVVPCDPQVKRSAVPMRAAGPLLRFSIGLEHPDDLIADLDRALTSLGG